MKVKTLDCFGKGQRQSHKYVMSSMNKDVFLVNYIIMCHFNSISYQSIED